MPMEVRVRDVKRWAGRRIAVLLAGDWPAALHELSEWPLVGSASGQVVVDNGGEFLAVAISGRAALDAECGRCLQPVRLDVPFDLRQEYREGEPRFEDEWLAYRQDVIGLDDVVTEAVLLAVPAVPLCCPDCRGLCPTCGRKLNERPCGCAGLTDERWSALAGWRAPEPRTPEEDAEDGGS